MFNNPFDSFHNTVAEAKEEREQLDRLLTVSTPRERQLVAAIAVLLLILLSWLFLGSVTRSVAVDAAMVVPDEDLRDASRVVRALAWVDSDIAADIMAGMPASIELTAADGETVVLKGEITQFSAVPLSESLAALESAAPVSAFRIDIALDDGADVPSLAGRESRVVIEIGQQSPVALFRMNRSTDVAEHR